MASRMLIEGGAGGLVSRRFLAHVDCFRLADHPLTIRPDLTIACFSSKEAETSQTAARSDPEALRSQLFGGLDHRALTLTPMLKQIWPVIFIMSYACTVRMWRQQEVSGQSPGTSTSRLPTARTLRLVRGKADSPNYLGSGAPCLLDLVFDDTFLVELVQNRVENDVLLLFLGSNLNSIFGHEFQRTPRLVMGNDDSSELSACRHQSRERGNAR